MADRQDHSGMAALSICEALLLAIKDRELLPEHEIVGVLRDAAAAHEAAVGNSDEKVMHQAAAALINQIIASGYRVRQ
ncbi:MULTISPECIES: hypothetical protein [unclassified Ruegeria]|uniref:hypothetical protein n=1 Tax=unclassified Ruegeria TaxID=2625375 RepID=UPI00149188B7|nr:MULTISPECIES: hypothetical protein [unclassified Ruegeria]NOD37144.1 hypothetical protein [Ruegeria sp. HKCCD7296]NOE44294.1 hypothetical protein [Ruegeria sp. HKCCD7319]